MSLEISSSSSSSSSPTSTPSFATAFQRIDASSLLLIGLGAGASADSGLPTFAQLGAEYRDAASLDALLCDPLRVQRYWLAVADTYLGAAPHAGYAALGALVQRRRLRGQRCVVITTNIDGAAASQLAHLGAEVVELHGALRHWQCGGTRNEASRFPRMLAGRCSDALYDAALVSRWMRELDAQPQGDRDPGSYLRCPGCGGVLRPHVYLFGDGEKHFVVDAALQAPALWQEIRGEVALRREGAAPLALLEIGCGLRVPSLRRRFEELFFSAAQCSFVRVNPEYLSFLSDPPDAIDLASSYFPMQMSALEALQHLDSYLKNLSIK